MFCFRCKSLTLACFSLPNSNSQMQHFSAKSNLTHFKDDIFNAAFKFFPRLQLLDVSGFRLCSRTPIEIVVREQPSRVIIHQEKIYLSQEMKAEDLLKMSKNRLFQSLTRFQLDRHSLFKQRLKSKLFKEIFFAVWIKIHWGLEIGTLQTERQYKSVCSGAFQN